MNSKENNINGEISNEVLRLLYTKTTTPPPPQEDSKKESIIILFQKITLLHEITVDKKITEEQKKMLEDFLEKASSSSYSERYYSIGDVVEEIESMGFEVSEVSEESPQDARSNIWELDEIA